MTKTDEVGPDEIMTDVQIVIREAIVCPSDPPYVEPAEPPPDTLDGLADELRAELEELARSQDAFDAIVREQLRRPDIGHAIGRICARSQNGVEKLPSLVVDAAELYTRAANPGETPESIHEAILTRSKRIAVGVAADAWTWLPHEEWANATEVYPWVGKAEEWLACRGDETIEKLRAALVMWTLEELAKNHLVVQDALIASIDWRDMAGPTTPAERDVLTTRVCNRLRSIVARARAIHDEGDQLPLDAAYIDEITALGKKGKENAEQIATSIPGMIEKFGRWYGWLPEVRPVRPPRRLRTLAKLLWRDEVNPELKQDAKRRKRSHASLAMCVHEDIMKMHSRRGTVAPQNPAQLVFDDGSSIAFDRCPLLEEDTLAVVARGIRRLGSVDAHRLLRFEVQTGYMRWLDGIEPMHVIDVEGGYGELAELLRIRDKGAPQRLRDILMAQRVCSFPLPGPDRGTGNLIILSEWKGSGRRPGRIRIELGTMLMPNYGQDLKQVLSSRELARSKKLVPLIELPPFVGRAHDHGAQATLSMLVMRELRWRAVELVRDGGARIGIERWAALADEARIPRSQVAQQLRPILDRWTRDGDDGPAFLKTIGKEPLYTLGDTYTAARRFLIAGGKNELTGASAGQKSGAARKAKLTRAAARRGG